MFTTLQREIQTMELKPGQSGNNGIEAGTKWEDVPDDWECPVCGASKDKFNKLKKKG
jgi:rubredoxin